MVSRTTTLQLEMLELRVPLAGDLGPRSGQTWHNAALPTDVNADQRISPIDALLVINALEPSALGAGSLPAAPPDNQVFLDTNGDAILSPLDALLVVNDLALAVGTSSLSLAAAGTFQASFNAAEQLGPQNLLTTSDVTTLLQRASMASPSTDAIIAVVDRSGRILGVRVESGVNAALRADPQKLAFAVDGAVAKARTAAYFSNNEAPLTSRTIRFISQSTMTQREVQSSPANADPSFRGPGFVAPIGTGGHFPPQVAFTPLVDLFAIEHQSRDSQFLSTGMDGVPANSSDPSLNHRFNVAATNIAAGAEDFFSVWPESYGIQSQTATTAQSRGIGTLPGGIPLFKVVTNGQGDPTGGINLVGGIGVFFPGPEGFASSEQGFVHASRRGGVPQSEFDRINAPRVLESEFIALTAAVGEGMVGPSAFVRNLNQFTAPLPPLPDFVLPIGRIDLVGITLEIYGPNPRTNNRQPGIDTLIDVGDVLNGPGANSGANLPVLPSGETVLSGQAVPEGWLVVPHDASDGSLTADQVEQIITQGIDEANLVRAAIRLAPGFRPGARTKMVLSVADTSGEVLGLFRMPDATVFSIDVAVAKSRNTAYYNDAADLQAADRIDFNGQGMPGPVSQSFGQFGNTVPLGTALTNRTFRFLVAPRYPTGIQLSPGDALGLVNSSTLDYCDQKPVACLQVGPQSILRLPGINPLTAENLVDTAPQAITVYANTGTLSTLAFTAFNANRNFRDPGDAGVFIVGSNPPIAAPLANQNGVVYFPGSTSLHVAGSLNPAGGFGVSGDGVDQDDVVTSFGQLGFAPPTRIHVDQFLVGGVRLPFQKFNRNPLGP